MKPADPPSSVLGDLIATRETPNRSALPDRKSRARAGRREPAGSQEQRSLFGEILDWMLAPLLLLWPLSVAVTFLVARSLADAPFDRRWPTARWCCSSTCAPSPAPRPPNRSR